MASLLQIVRKGEILSEISTNILVGIFLKVVGFLMFNLVILLGMSASSLSEKWNSSSTVVTSYFQNTWIISKFMNYIFYS